MPSYSFSRTHQKLMDAMQAGESDLAYSLCLLLKLVAESDAKLAERQGHL